MVKVLAGIGVDINEILAKVKEKQDEDLSKSELIDGFEFL